MNKNFKKSSKLLSLILRHKPESVGLVLDANGWASVSDILRLTAITRYVLEDVVAHNDKQRFSFSQNGQMIRANQGHSVQGVDLQLEPVTPPDILYHGTVVRSLDGISANGLSKMKRHHVHLSASEGIAHRVGSRRGEAIILTIDAKLMSLNGFIFFLSANGVWLTDQVPSDYIQKPYTFNEKKAE